MAPVTPCTTCQGVGPPISGYSGAILRLAGDGVSDSDSDDDEGVSVVRLTVSISDRARRSKSLSTEPGPATSRGLRRRVLAPLLVLFFDLAWHRRHSVHRIDFVRRLVTSVVLSLVRLVVRLDVLEEFAR